jgi:hypothetical protein
VLLGGINDIIELSQQRDAVLKDLTEFYENLIPPDIDNTFLAFVFSIHIIIITRIWLVETILITNLIYLLLFRIRKIPYQIILARNFDVIRHVISFDQFDFRVVVLVG